MKKHDEKENTDSLVMFKGGVLEKGYGIVAKQVMQDTNLHIIAKSLYAYLCTYGTGAFPSRSLVMHHLGIGKDSFHKYMKQLKEFGYISSEQKIINGKFSSNVYTIEQTITPCPIKPDTDKKPKKPCTVLTDAAVSDTVKPDTNNTSINITNFNNTNTTTKAVAVAPICKYPNGGIVLPAGISQQLLADLAIKYVPIHGADIVDRQLINFKHAQARGTIERPAAWLTNACKKNYPSAENINLFAVQENKELENRLVEKLNTDSSSPYELADQDFKDMLGKRPQWFLDMIAGA